MTEVTAAADQPRSSMLDSSAFKDRRKDSPLRSKAVIPRKEKIGARCVAWYESDIDNFVSDPLGYRTP